MRSTASLIASWIQQRWLTIILKGAKGFEQVELTEPRKALDQAGAETHIVSPKDKEVRGWNFTDWSQSLRVDVKLDEARPEDFDALHVAGRRHEPGQAPYGTERGSLRESLLRRAKAGRRDLSRPVDDTGSRRGPRPAQTSWPSLKTDLKNAGADWVDQETMHDGNLVTSRKPDDIPAFNREMVKLFAAAHGQCRAA